MNIRSLKNSTKRSVQLISLLVLVIPLLLTANNVFANGSHGQYFEAPAGDYTMGVGTDVYTLVAGDPIRFDFNLYKKESMEPVVFSDIWVRIVKKDDDAYEQTIFAGGLYNPLFGYPGMTVVIPNSGNYELIVRFNNKKGESITSDVIFPLAFETNTFETKKSLWKGPLLAGIFGLAVGSAATHIIKRKRTP